MDRHSPHLSWRDVFLHSAVGIAIALLLWSSGFLQGIEADTFDLRVNMHAAPSSATRNIVVVRLDQESLNHVAEITGISWPWPRQLFAAVINNCKRRGALAVGFDVIFSEYSSRGVKDDWYLGNAIRNAENFALGSVFPTMENTALHAKWPDDIPRPSLLMSDESGLQTIPTYPRASFPIPDIIGGRTILSNIQHQPDKDGIYRRLYPFVLFDGEPLPALGIGMYLAAHPEAETIVTENKIVVDGHAIPLDSDGMALLNYRGPSQTFSSLHASSLIFQEMSIEEGLILPDEVPKDLQGKYVLFGFTARALYDTKTSPLGKIAGPEINATLLDNLLSEDFIIPLSLGWMVVSLVGLTLLSSLLISLLPSFRSQILSGILFLLLPAFIAIVAYRAGYNYTFVPVQIAVVIGTAFSGFRAYSLVQGQEKFIRHSFKHYLSPAVIDQLIQNPDRLSLGGERKELSFFFSDLQGFTQISEWLAPEDLIQLLNEYLTAMTNIILEEEGTVDKFEGDAIIAFWNAPLPLEDHAERAVRAAINCQQKLEEMRPYFLEQYGIRLVMRIGINTGFAVVGNMGTSSRFDYSVLGDAVNLAARLEGANKHFGTFTMISSMTFSRLGMSFHCRELGRLKVIGRSEPVTVYEPLSFDKVPSTDYTDFERGLEHFYLGDFATAFEVFKGRKHSDPVARIYHRKCKELLDGKRGEWSGVWELDTK